MKGRKDLLLILALFAGLVAVVYMLVSGQSTVTARERRSSVHSSARLGSSALAQWMRELGFDTRNLESANFSLDPNLDLLFVINPSFVYPYKSTEAEKVRRWVEAGHTLIYAPRWGSGDDLAKALGLSYKTSRDLRTGVAPVQPLMINPAPEFVEMRSNQTIASERTDVVYLGPPGEALILARRIGRGRVIALAGDYPFSNEGLKVPGNARMVLNLLWDVPDGGTIGFDEYHHGFAEGSNLLSEFYRSPWGWAAIYALAVFLIFILLQGQRFARVFPPALGNRRTMAEYVHSMASVYRRAGQRPAILRQYAEDCKRDLGRLHGIDPLLPADQYAAKLATVTKVEAKRVETLLEMVNRPKPNEKEFLTVASEIEKLREELSGDRRRNQPAHR